MLQAAEYGPQFERFQERMDLYHPANEWSMGEVFRGNSVQLDDPLPFEGRLQFDLTDTDGRVSVLTAARCRTSAVIAASDSSSVHLFTLHGLVDPDKHAASFSPYDCVVGQYEIDPESRFLRELSLGEVVRLVGGVPSTRWDAERRLQAKAAGIGYIGDSHRASPHKRRLDHRMINAAEVIAMRANVELDTVLGRPN